MKHITTGLFTALSLAAMAACNNGQQPPAQTEQAAISDPASVMTAIKDLQWLAGKWHMDAPSDGVAFENWKVVDDSTMQGISGFIKGKDTMISETMSLEMRGGVVNYIPTVKDQNNSQPVPFKMTFSSADSFVFENPAHDFPTLITYVRRSATMLMASISGKMNGQEHTEQFPMTKVE